VVRARSGGLSLNREAARESELFPTVVAWQRARRCARRDAHRRGATAHGGGSIGDCAETRGLEPALLSVIQLVTAVRLEGQGLVARRGGERVLLAISNEA